MTLYDALRAAFADTFAVYFMAHSAHWNVQGDDFPAMHEFFETIYSEVYGAVDPMAEHIRSMGGMAPVSLAAVLTDVSVSEMGQPYTCEGMLRSLQLANRRVMVSLTIAYEAAGKTYGLQNFLAERLDKHAKHQWMLDATLSDL